LGRRVHRLQYFVGGVRDRARCYKLVEKEGINETSQTAE